MPAQRQPFALLPFGVLCLLIGAGAAYVGYHEIGEFSVPTWVMYPLGAFFAFAGLLLLVLGLLGHFAPAALTRQLDTHQDQLLVRALFIPLLGSLVVLLWGMCWDNPAYGPIDRLLIGALAVVFTGAWGLLVYDTLRRVWHRAR